MIKMPKLRLVFATLTALAAGLVVAAASIGASGQQPSRNIHVSVSERLALGHMSRAAQPFEMPLANPHTQAFFREGYGNVRLLSNRGGRNFFAVDHAGGHTCYGAGTSGAAWPFAMIRCRTAAPYFPSAELPIVDMSTVSASIGAPQLTFERVQGIAADGVATIDGLDASGNTVVSTPVSSNVYAVANVPAGVTKIEAVDSSGNVLTTVP